MRLTKKNPKLIEHRTNEKNKTAVVFIHGFGGDVAATWGKFPDLLKGASQLNGWDIYSIGYPTKLRLDLLAGLWSADPDLTLLGLSLHSTCKVSPLNRYDSLALVAHSMGGLIVQRALLSHADLLQRISYIFLFGTPSGGLEKATPFQWLKRQIRDMSPENPFIKDLRAGWKTQFGVPNQDALNCEFWSIAGEEDEFVPAESSLGPFAPEFFPKANLAAVPGNHVQIVKPADVNNRGVQLVLKALQGKAAPAGRWNSAAVALESRDFKRVVKELGPHEKDLDDAALVQLALALESLGQSAKALALLENRSNAGETSAQLDAMGVLAGRLKRRWLAERNEGDAKRASELYGEGFALADKAGNHDMAYYLGINLAFMKLAYNQDRTAAKALAEKVLEHCRLAGKSMWCLATQGEANLILGNTALALQGYREAVASNPTPRQMESMYNQAMKAADLVNDLVARSGLEEIFRPVAPKAPRKSQPQARI